MATGMTRQMTYRQAVEAVAEAIEAERLRLNLPLRVEMLPHLPGWCRVRDEWDAPVEVEAGLLLRLLRLIPWPLPPGEPANLAPRTPGVVPPNARHEFWDAGVFWAVLAGCRHGPDGGRAHDWAFGLFEDLLKAEGVRT